MVNLSLSFPWRTFMLLVARRILLGAGYVQIGNADGGIARYWDMGDACLFLDRVWNGQGFVYLTCDMSPGLGYGNSRVCS